MCLAPFSPSPLLPLFCPSIRDACAPPLKTLPVLTPGRPPRPHSAMMRTSMKQQEAIMAAQMMMTETLLHQSRDADKEGDDDDAAERGDMTV